jgi:hypothetical protein
MKCYENKVDIGSHTDSKPEVFSYRKPQFSPTLLLTKFCRLQLISFGKLCFRRIWGPYRYRVLIYPGKVGVNDSRMYRIGCHIYSSFLTQMQNHL